MNEKEIYKMLNNFPQLEITKYILNIQEENKSLRGNIKFHAEKSKNRYNEIINLKRKITKLECKLQQKDEAIEKSYKLLKIFQSEFDVTDEVYKEIKFILDILNEKKEITNE